MRRPTFDRWIKREVLRAAGTESFNFRKLAAQAQRDDAPKDLAPALLLYANETHRADKLLALLWNDALREEYEDVLGKIGGRSAGRLALRSTPMMSLRPAYWKFLARFADAYYAPERIASEKRELWEVARRAQLETGTSSSQVARECGLDIANVNMFLSHADLGRLTAEDARRITDYLTSL